MNSAQFKTIREAIGLSVTDAAEVFSVEPRTIRYWESGRNKIPPGAANEITAIDKTLDNVAAQTLIFYREKALPGKPERVLLYRFRDTKNMSDRQGKFKDWPVSVHAAMLHRLKKLLEKEGVQCSIEYSDPVK